MTVVTVTYDAKCKHCKHLKGGNPLKNNGQKSKRVMYFCNNPKSGLFKIAGISKFKACDNFEII